MKFLLHNLLCSSQERENTPSLFLSAGLYYQHNTAGIHAYKHSYMHTDILDKWKLGGYIKASDKKNQIGLHNGITTGSWHKLWSYFTIRVGWNNSYKIWLQLHLSTSNSSLNLNFIVNSNFNFILQLRFQILPTSTYS